MTINEFKSFMQCQLKIIKESLKDDCYSKDYNYYVMQWIEKNAKDFRDNWNKKEEVDKKSSL